MKLYCEACNVVHSFPPGEVEQIVYALEAMERDARLTHAQDRDGAGQCEPYGTVKEHGYVRAEPECFQQVLAAAGDSECYAEHVKASVERRRADVTLREAT